MMRQGLLTVSSNEQIDAEESERRQNLAEDAPEQLTSRLVAQIQLAWSRNKRARQRMDKELLNCMRQRKGEYEPDELALIKQGGGGNEIYMMLTATKCAAAAAWISDVMLPSDDLPVGVEATVIPDLPVEVYTEMMHRVMQAVEQQSQASGQPMDQSQVDDAIKRVESEVKQRMNDSAKERAENMTTQLHDTLQEGGLRHALEDYIEDFVTFPTAILKGPIYRMKPEIEWGPNWQPIVHKRLKCEVERISPFDAYPSPDAETCDDGEFIERLRMTRKQLSAMRGRDGYHSEAIEDVLRKYRDGSNRHWLWTDAERSELENKESWWMSPPNTIDAIHYWGSASGMDLMQWGMDADSLDPLEEYDIEAILIDSECIRCVINDDPMGRRPYQAASFRRLPGAFWGESLPFLVRNTQKMCNASARALADNLSIACLPGDTVVYRHQKLTSKHQRKRRLPSDAQVTLAELWDQKQNKNSGLRRNVLRSLDESTGEFIGNRVVDIFDNGVRPVYSVMTRSGYQIKATMNHRFLRDDGEYAVLARFSVGDCIAVNGTAVKRELACVDCHVPIVKPGALRCKSCAAKVNRWNVAQADAAVNNMDASETTARGRKRVKECKKAACETCGGADRLHIHHLDKNPMNCGAENLMTLCEPCHKKWHVRHGHYGDAYRHTFVDYDEIVSIEYFGDQQVFDLQMTAPNHNFVANGFVSHNSGPQVIINNDALADGEDVTNIYPWKMWQTSYDQNGSGAGAPINFYQPSSNANELLAVFKEFEQRADDESSIPRYTYGNEKVGGAGSTASGLSMLFDAASKGIRKAIGHIDAGVMRPLVEKAWMDEMRFGDDPSIKGDANIVARGATALLIKDQAQHRRQEFLTSTNNPTDMQIIQLTGRAEVLRAYASSLDMDVDKIVPKREEIEQRMQQQNQPDPKAQNDQAKLQLDAQKAKQGAEQKAQELGEKSDENRRQFELDQDRLKLDVARYLSGEEQRLLEQQVGLLANMNSGGQNTTA